MLKASLQDKTCPEAGAILFTFVKLSKETLLNSAEDTLPKDKFPEPSVFKIWPGVPSVVGKIKVVLLSYY